jgi:DNA-binding CsgD family transcriptional regulator
VEASEQADLLARYRSLTPREQEVLPLLVRGLLNKQAAAELGISEYTVQIHRGNIMRKMKADSFAMLVKLATRLSPKGSPQNNIYYIECFMRSWLYECHQRQGRYQRVPKGLGDSQRGATALVSGA